MKKSRRILLAAVLSLCLLLTGCYIAPDDVNTNPTNSSGNALPFITLAPTNTVYTTPDTVVVETQNVFGGPSEIRTTDSSATPTPSPSGGSSGGWYDWGTVQQPDQTGDGPTPTPIGNTIVFDDPGTSPDSEQTPGGIAVITETPVTPAPVTQAPTTKAPIVTPTPTPPWERALPWRSHS